MDNNLSNNFECGNDFYSFVNSDWIKSTEIPDEYQSWGTFQIIEENTSQLLQKISSESINSDNKNYQKIGIIYNQIIENYNSPSPNNFCYIQKILVEIENILSVDELLNKITEYDFEFGITPFSLKNGTVKTI